uniref:Apple domain-containing protein n=1 Tax=Emiliania huxleyi TaxID=2903 RepID=A0A7S3TFY8_EMIHU|mmetsp:Transcript_3622/g.10677  ORF Transcript_3622/g.10677 Transcript_3622/m.10677 type:complete len:257 (+) Transcript_3622:138-908(+)
MAPRAAQAMITAAAALLLIGQAMRHRPLELRRQLREVDAPAVGALEPAASAVAPAAARRSSPPPANRPPAPSPPPAPRPPSELALRSAADPSCNPTPHAGFSGGSLNWGMSFHVGTAQECCDACKAHARVCGAPGAGGRVYLNRSWEGKVSAERCAKTMTSNELGTHAAQACNVFVFCPTPPSAGGLCWSNDVWNHSSGECWLKSQAAPQRPHAGAFGAYPDAYRKKHRTAPEKVQWMSGALHPGPVTVDGPHWHW